MIPSEGVAIARIVSLLIDGDTSYVTIYYLGKTQWVRPFMRHLVAKGNIPYLEWVRKIRKEKEDRILIGI